MEIYKPSSCVTVLNYGGLQTGLQYEVERTQDLADQWQISKVIPFQYGKVLLSDH